MPVTGPVVAGLMGTGGVINLAGVGSVDTESPAPDGGLGFEPGVTTRPAYSPLSPSCLSVTLYHFKNHFHH